jgi:pimeloyl-ACP methyl ester carboxylesterase
MKRSYLLLILFFTFVKCFTQTSKKSEMVTLNGNNIYYEVYGNGEPLFLLHGFTQSSKSWLHFVNEYANEFEVYLVDLKGHGKSSQFTEKLSIRSAAMDIDALIKHLKLDTINAIGYSYGGDILFQLALLHPGLIKSMICIGACGSWDAKDFPTWVEYLSYNNLNNLPWMHEQQTSLAQIRSILDQVPNYIISVSGDEMKTIQTKTLLVLGDQDDSIPLECISRTRKNLPHSFLWILPNTGHGAHTDKNKADFVKLSKEFLNNGWLK